MPTDWSASRPAHSSVVAFNVLEILGAIGMLILFFTASISASINRNFTWFCFCLSWIISGISFALLLISGQVGKAVPDENVCWAQAALIYAAPPLTICTTGALLIPIWYNLRITSSSTLRSNGLTLLLIIPFLVWAGFIALIFTFNTQHASSVRLNDRLTYCIVDHPIIPNITPVFVAIIACAVLALAGLIIWQMHRNSRDTLRKNQSPSSVIRILVFTFLCFVALVFGIVFSIISMPSIAYDIAMACLPLIGVAIFGSQQDLVKAWACTRSRTSKYQPLHTQ